MAQTFRLAISTDHNFNAGIKKLLDKTGCSGEVLLHLFTGSGKLGIIFNIEHNPAGI